MALAPAFYCGIRVTIVYFGIKGNFTLKLHSKSYTTIKCVGKEAIVYMLKSDELHGHVKWMKKMTVFSSLTCGDICLNTGF